MNRDNANRELNRLVAYYRELPFAELLGLAEQPAIETESTAPDGVVTFVVDVRSRGGYAGVRLGFRFSGQVWFRAM